MPNPPHTFATTHWTLVWQAAQKDAQSGKPALEELVRQYWHPLYHFARGRGLGPEDAEDATQDFLESIVRGDLLGNADPARGKFRTYLLAAWKRFLIDRYRRETAQRRGGKARMISFDFQSSEQDWLASKSANDDPERLFSAAWAQSQLELVRQRLREEYARGDRSLVFEALVTRLTSRLNADDYSRLAKELALTPSAVKVALHRLRHRFGQTLRTVVAETLDESDDIEAEIDELIRALSQR